ncbi:RDD family protein [Arthrobacter sp. Y-9]|uniref:RDD family protein n=1 Tax=Arthrobacter sp. Y-9 TaxID=3039385 RepID=UPI00241D12B8|nr:RDD family protein [Arthrobacter sp. Y-9]WFR84957.1 RDD family protein [Arthrobacter sp. Y-9]
MSINVERCPQCQQQLTPGAGFCLACGTSLSNRAALRNGVQHPQQPGGAPQGGPWQSSSPGIVAQHPDQLPATQPVVRAGAAKRLFSKLIDLAVPGIIAGVLLSVGTAALLKNGLAGSANLGPSQEDVIFAVIMSGLAVLIWLAYVVTMWIMEARSGNSLGNAIFGIRTTELEGYAPGAGAVFLRWLVLLAPNILFALVGGIMSFFAPAGVVQVVGGIGSIVSFVWLIVAGVSNAWDPNERQQGWHDKVARTLVFDVRAGRNPVTTEGIAGTHSYPTLDLPAVRPVVSPLAAHGQAQQTPQQAQQQPAQQQAVTPVVVPQPGPAAPQPQGRQVPPVPQAPFPAQFGEPAQPEQPDPQQYGQQQYGQPQYGQPAPFAPPQQQFAPPAAPADHGETMLRAHLPSGAAGQQDSLVLLLDDGAQVPLEEGVLIGRNPTARAGEERLRLLALDDAGRSISKTHLLVVPASGGAWVTDRQSTNGSGEMLADGTLVRLVAGEARFVRPGSTVKFGDRTFKLSTP